MTAPDSSYRYNWFFVLASVAILLCYYLVAFYPYSFALPVQTANGVIRQPDGVLSFAASGIGFIDVGNNSKSAEAGDREVRFAIDVRSLNSDQDGPARIVSLSTSPELRNFTIAQQNSDLVVRVRRSNSNLNGMPDMTVPGVFADNHWHLVDVRVLSAMINIVVDDVPRLSVVSTPAATRSWNWSYPWVLGNERTGNRPWHGEIRSAVFCMNESCSDMLQADKLKLPANYWIGNWNTLVDRRYLFASNVNDILINIVGFMPFGFLLAYTRKPALAFGSIVTSAFIASLSIEIGQIFFEGRFSSLVDIICNVAGAGLGYMVVSALIFNHEGS